MTRAARKIEKPRPVSRLVRDRLREDILTGRFNLGEKLSEGQLSERYGVTKAPIRAAFIYLQSEGLLDIRPQSGTYVFLPTTAEVRALCELRSAIEIEALHLATERGGRAFRHQLVDITARMRSAQSAGKMDDYRRLDADLHFAILAHADSPMLEETYRSKVAGRFEALRSRFSVETEHQTASITEHIALKDYIVAGDMNAAEHLLRRHIDNTRCFFAQMIDSKEGR